MQSIFNFPLRWIKSFKFGWDLKSNVQKYSNNSNLQKDWAFDLIGKSHHFVGNEEILDIGSGDGKLTYLLSRFGRSATGVDISEEMIKFSKNNYGHFENLQFIKSLNGNLNLVPPRSFDLATAFCVLHLVKNPTDFLKETREKLNKNGKLIFTLPCTNNPYFHKALMETCKEFDFALPEKTEEQKKVKTVEGMSEIAKNAGFKNITVKRVSTKNPFASKEMMIDWFIGTFSANIHLPQSIAKEFNTKLVNRYLDLDPESKGQHGYVYYNVDRIDGVLIR